MSEPILCYVKHAGHGFGHAYFTTRALHEQWGDDWDDAPHQYNAGTPYGPLVYHYSNGDTLRAPEDFNADGSPKWEIARVAYYLPGFEAAGSDGDAYLSVQQINSGAAPWLRSGDGLKVIPAGTPLSEFLGLARELRGFAMTEEGDGE